MCYIPLDIRLPQTLWERAYSEESVTWPDHAIALVSKYRSNQQSNMSLSVFFDTVTYPSEEGTMTVATASVCGVALDVGYILRPFAEERERVEILQRSLQRRMRISDITSGVARVKSSSSSSRRRMSERA